MSERISSLHDDLYVPKATEHLGEYQDYPERFDPSQKSVITRLEQFGINLQAVQENLNKDIKDLSWEEYNELLAASVKARYDVIVSSVFDQYMFPTTEDPNREERLNKMFKLMKNFEDMELRCGVNFIHRKADLKEGGNLVLGLEAGAHLINNLDDLKKLVAADIKLFGLQYNKDNAVANNSSGLTTLGVQSVRYLLDNNLIVDLAHSSKKTRQGVMDIAQDQGKGHLVSYTHGSSEEDLMASWKDKVGERALSSDEVKRIIKIGGIVGLGVTEPFFTGTKKLAERINNIAQLDHGIDRVAIGTDFGGVAPSMLQDIKSPEDFKILGDILSEDFDMPDQDIDKVLRANVKEWIGQAID